MRDIELVRVSRTQIGFYMAALERYRSDVGTYPSSQEGLRSLREKPAGKSGWKGPYLQQDVENDAWGRPYFYMFPSKHGEKPDLVSYGKDGRPGGAGADEDITSRSL
jgi:general secretion pathway protein G